eukprot:5207566-Pyramimonas_sp.AAC.1
MDIDEAVLKGLAYRELAEATGEKERMACFTLPLSSASELQSVVFGVLSDQARAPKTPLGRSR